MRLMDGIDAFYTLDLDRDQVFYKQIDAVTEIDPLALIDHRQADLLGNSKTLFPKFMSKAGFVGAFEQAGAEMRMNFHRRGNHVAGDPIDTRSGDDCCGHHERL